MNTKLINISNHFTTFWGVNLVCLSYIQASGSTRHNKTGLLEKKSKQGWRAYSFTINRSKETLKYIRPGVSFMYIPQFEFFESGLGVVNTFLLFLFDMNTPYHVLGTLQQCHMYIHS